MAQILITGHKHGLGKVIYKTLVSDGHTVFGYDIEDGNDVLNPKQSSCVLKSLSMDIGYGIRRNLHGLEVLINCVGINQFENLEEEMMDVNAKGIFMMTRACLPSLILRKGTILNIVSKGSSVDRLS